MNFARQRRAVAGVPLVFLTDIRVVRLGYRTAPAQKVSGRIMRVRAAAVVTHHCAELGHVLLGEVIFALPGLEKLRLDRRKRGERPAVAEAALVLDGRQPSVARRVPVRRKLLLWRCAQKRRATRGL